VGSESDQRMAGSQLGGGLPPAIVDRLLNLGAEPANAATLMRGEDAYTYGGLPYRGDPSLCFKKDDPSWRKPQLRYQTHVKVFDLANAESLREYEGICQQVADGRVMISFEKIEFDRVLRSWLVLLRWMDVFFQEPDRQPATKADVEKGPSNVAGR